MSDSFIIVIPCYNEELRLNLPQYTEELENNPQVCILFVDDGSKDNTIGKIQELKNVFPERVSCLVKKQNGGKSLAVYDGFKYALSSSVGFGYIGYIDADLAVSISEISAIKEFIALTDRDFGFGSRWHRIGSNIERKFIRHYIGRLFATIASMLLDLGVYDTQCGAKVFKRDLAEKIFIHPFNVSWAFDVEIFFRLLQIFHKDEFDKHCIEYPLQQWRDVEGSKVKYLDSIRVMRDFLILRKIYSK